MPPEELEKYQNLYHIITVSYPHPLSSEIVEFHVLNTSFSCRYIEELNISDWENFFLILISISEIQVVVVQRVFQVFYFFFRNKRS